jgi:N-methylhydantoinase B
LRALTVHTRPGTVVDPLPPAAVAAGNVETSQRIVDVLLRALAQAAPDRVPAASQGTMNNTLLGGTDPRTGEPFTYYETLGGGCGAGPWGPGTSGTHSHMTNTRNTPIEAFELAYPLRVVAYRLRDGSGGAGQHRGGDGLVRVLEVHTDDATASLLTERRDRGPWGLAGGDSGAPGRNLLLRDGTERPLPAKTTLRLARGDRLVVATPGGGGYGSPAPPTSDAYGTDEPTTPSPASPTSPQLTTTRSWQHERTSPGTGRPRRGRLGRFDRTRLAGER